MEDTNLAILVDAKTEYTNQLVNFLKGRSYRCVKDIFDETKRECVTENKTDSVFVTFQKNLSEIPKWNENKIKDEYEKMIIHSKCDWLEELLTAVFISHTRILTSIHNKTNNKKPINLTIPKPENFVHQCYIDIARIFWKSPYLFDDSISNYDFQRNRRDIEVMIEKCIHETIRRQLPVKVILKQYLGDTFKENSVEDFAQMEDNMTNKSKENLKQMVQQELKTMELETASPQEATETHKETKDETKEESLEATETPEETKDETKEESLEATETPDETPEETKDETKENITLTVNEKPELDSNQLFENEDKNLLETIQLDDLEDLSENLTIDKKVYDLLQENNIKEEVKEELETLNSDSIKKVSLTEQPLVEKTTVTKKDNYTFFNDAPPLDLE